MASSSNQTPNAFHEVVPPSATSGPSSDSTRTRKRAPWDVFINHRGPDTKLTLATSIYTALKSMGLEVFLDQPELDLGDLIPATIQEAMETSFLHIAILSSTYAESPWCLAELSFMIKTGKPIIPVFYKVDPKDIRWIAEGKGIYTAAFGKLQESGRYSSEKLEDWKLALQKVSYKSGRIVKGNDDEGTKLLEDIQDYIKRHFVKYPLVLDNYPVGLDQMLTDFERTISHSSESIKIVGIVGMGGSGKTTLAKAYYNKTRFSIFKCIFIHNVRHRSEKDICNRQKKMLQDLGFNNAGEFDDVETGKSILAKHLRSVQVFIILDDVDCEDQLESLLPIKDIDREGSLIVGQGSVIVVTSRESKVLKSWGISSIYQMKRLNREHAMILFCRHAFQPHFPRNGFENLVEDFLKICQGLPLSLKVLGGLVQGEPEQAGWASTLEKVRRVLPKGIKMILKVSFDALDEEEKEIFVDICCFFIGEKEELAVTVWDGSGWSGLHSLQRLKSKCLVEVDEDNCITMHDHLRDMGREIANNGKEMDKSPYRLWSSEQIRSIEIEGQGGLLNRGIRAETEKFFEECMKLVKHVTGSYNRFKRRLEILVLNENSCIQELAALSEGLVWFRSNFSGHRPLPSWLPLKNLRILELRSYDGILELWSETDDPPKQLRELVVSNEIVDYDELDGRFVGFPSSIGHLQHLKKISLHLSIEGLPDEFCQLQSLEYLKLSGCGNLESLPSNFGDLKNLRHLDLSHTGLMMLPASFKDLINLQYIKLNYCYDLTLQTDMLKNITKLEVMHAKECLNITKLPAQIANQKSLKKLKVDTTSSVGLDYSSGLMELPNNIGELSKLEELTIKTSSLKTLPSSIGNLYSLTSLHISSEELETLPRSMGNLSSLTSLIIASEKLESLPRSMGKLSSLTSLDIWSEKLETLPRSMGKLSSLTSLDIWSEKLKTLPRSMGNLSSLTRLKISSKKLKTLPPSIGNLSSLTRLQISSKKLKKLPPSIGNLSSLTSLNISSEKLEYLPEELTQLTSLQDLVIELCTSLRELNILSGCCPSSLRSLKSIFVRDTMVSRISISQQCCPSLEVISLDRNHQLVEIHSLPISVKRISLTLCEKLKSISGVCGLVKLEELVIEEQSGKELEELPNFEELVSLKELEMRGLGEGVKIIKGLEYCTSLERLIAHTGSKELKMIKCSLQRMESLRIVQLLAWNISAVEPCFQIIKKGPSDCIVCARAGSGVEAALESWLSSGLSSLGLTLVDSFKGKKRFKGEKRILKCGPRDSSNAAVIMCFVVNLISDDTFFLWGIDSPSMTVKEGKCVWIGVFTQSSRLARTEEFKLDGHRADEDMGMSMMGEEERVVDAFYQLLRVFGK